MRQRYYFSTLDEIVEGQFTIRELGNRSVGATLLHGKPIVVLNFCPHAGAPICSGKITPKQILEASHELTLDPEHPVLRCPWHGWEFSLENGRTVFESRLRLAYLEFEINESSIFVWV
ncbi:Rieske (2Fe-2S) protein [Haliscomenobacter hydrossis]|uniref:Rieske (2Fe-2S) iron-sulfur domain protein n=1 Tax=Haliscomenobacter hydrossis (strain ATCC 27775 / DSM 1100 / LMG 10767 / O) TaxID=760192 RepID=F4KXV8_HALH1|nr:Rieske (2Fe-2S) protein [Haliscomenobacter hydrossis]AEE52617.1 Rieske (2Fe-2S) iron-sulfur domain protein [Haliscomenobacter hydrossis DSM 1100]